MRGLNDIVAYQGHSINVTTVGEVGDKLCGAQVGHANTVKEWQTYTNHMWFYSFTLDVIATLIVVAMNFLFRFT